MPGTPMRQQPTLPTKPATPIKGCPGRWTTSFTTTPSQTGSRAQTSGTSTPQSPLLWNTPGTTTTAPSSTRTTPTVPRTTTPSSLGSPQGQEPQHQQQLTSTSWTSTISTDVSTPTRSPSQEPLKKPAVSTLTPQCSSPQETTLGPPVCLLSRRRQTHPRCAQHPRPCRISCREPRI